MDEYQHKAYSKIRTTHAISSVYLLHLAETCNTASTSVVIFLVLQYIHSFVEKHMFLRVYIGVIYEPSTAAFFILIRYIF